MPQMDTLEVDGRGLKGGTKLVEQKTARKEKKKKKGKKRKKKHKGSGWAKKGGL